MNIFPKTVRLGNGVSVLEILVAMVIFTGLLLTGYQVFSHVFFQGQKQDQRTIAWQTYCRFSENLRNDMNKAWKVEILSGKELEIRTIQLGPNLERVQGTVNYSMDGERAVIRQEGGSRVKFDFSGALSRGEKITLAFSPMP